MQDTRLWSIKDDLEAVLSGHRELVDGPRITPRRDSDLAYELLEKVVQAHQILVELMGEDMPLCLKYSTVGSRCTRQAEHEGPHRSVWGSQWTDDGDSRFAASIAASMEGRRD